MQTQSNKIINRLSKSSKGKIIFANDFANIASSENIRQILSRLEKDSVIIRLAHGIYYLPKKDELLGILYPTVNDIALEIAKRDKVRISPSGSMAMYILGLTTQIPLKAVYLTDGTERIINLKNGSIKFKKVVPKHFAIKDKLLILIVNSIKEIGKNNLTKQQESILIKHLTNIPQIVLAKQLRYAPVWIQKIILKLKDEICG